MESPSSTAAAAPPSFSHPRVFRLGDWGRGGMAAGSGEEIHSGFDALDRELAGGGWAKPGVTEILCNHTGIGELSLLMKGLGSKANAVRPGDAVHLMWVMPHTQAWIPYAPALSQCGIDLRHLAIVRTQSTDEALWAAEQGLKSGACRAVLLRMNEAWVNPLSLRRLQQAAMAGNSILWLMRPLVAAQSPSPAGTRIVLTPQDSGALTLELLKRRGLPAGKSIRLVTRSLACLTREPRVVRAPAKTSSIGWLDRVLSGTVFPVEEKSANVRARSFTRERG
ncbi:MAG: SOS cell division inhibitor SulA [Betaproteobacteria bacterium]